MSGAHFRFDQAANVTPTGTTDTTRLDVYQDQPLKLHRTDLATGGPTFLLLAGPAGQSLTLTNPNTDEATLANPKPGSYVAELIVGDGVGANTLRMVFRVRLSSTGLSIDGGICDPAFGEQEGDDNAGGNIQGYAPAFAKTSKEVVPTVATLAGLRGVVANRITAVRVPTADGGSFRWNATNNNTTRPDNADTIWVPTGLATGCWERQYSIRILTSGLYSGKAQVGDAATPIVVPSIVAGVVVAGAGGQLSGVAALPGTLVSPDFGAQDITTSGNLHIDGNFTADGDIDGGLFTGTGLIVPGIQATSLTLTGLGAGIVQSSAGGVFSSSNTVQRATILASDLATHIPATVKGFASQSADLQQWVDSTGAVLSAMTKDGFIGLAVGAVGTPSFFFQGDPNTGIYHVGADDVALVANGVKKIEYNATGLGFFAAAPVAKPAVTGGMGDFTTNGALEKLLAALVSLGLITDTSTAGLAIQVGNASLVAGGKTAAIAANVSGTTRILCSVKSGGGTATAGTVGFGALTADRVNGTPGSFIISPIDKDGNFVAGYSIASGSPSIDWIAY